MIKTIGYVVVREDEIAICGFNTERDPVDKICKRLNDKYPDRNYMVGFVTGPGVSITPTWNGSPSHSCFGIKFCTVCGAEVPSENKAEDLKVGVGGVEHLDLDTEVTECDHYYAMDLSTMTKRCVKCRQPQ